MLILEWRGFRGCFKRERRFVFQKAGSSSRLLPIIQGIVLRETGYETTTFLLLRSTYAG
jgi:hypothetical protein